MNNSTLESLPLEMTGERYLLSDLKNILRSCHSSAHLYADNTNHLTTLLLRYPFASWNWEVVSAHQLVTFEFTQEHPELPWSPAGLSRNPNLTRKIVHENESYPWFRHNLLFNVHLRDEFTVAHCNYKFEEKHLNLWIADMNYLTFNGSVARSDCYAPNVTMDQICAFDPNYDRYVDIVELFVNCELRAALTRRSKRA